MSDLSEAIRELEDAEAELDAANQRAAEALDGYDAARRRCSMLGLKVDLTIPSPLGLAADGYFNDRDRSSAQERVIALDAARKQEPPLASRRAPRVKAS